MELVLYYIKESASLLISFLTLIFVLGIFTYLAIRNFRQDSKLKVSFYGLFLGLKNIDILKLSIVIIKLFLVIYAIIITIKETVFICLIMIILLSLIYIFLAPKRIVYEVVSSLIEIVMVYFINIINNYMSEIDYSPIILMIKVCLIVFTLLLSTYFFLRDVGDIVDNRWNNEFSKNRKDLENGKQSKSKKEE